MYKNIKELTTEMLTHLKLIFSFIEKCSFSCTNKSFKNNNTFLYSKM